MASSSSCSSRSSLDASTDFQYAEKHAFILTSESSCAQPSVPLRATVSGAFVNLLTSPTRLFTRCCIRFMHIISPSFLHRNHDTEQHGDLSPTAFLDGMRGLAAFVVFICHLTYGSFDLTYAYGAIPSISDSVSDRHDSFLRLPIVRLLYSGPPMVAIFFIVSGFALSYKPIRLMHSRQHETFMMTMTSSMFRRGFRLFLPCFVSTFIVICLAQLNLYSMTETFSKQMRGVKEDHCYTQPNFWSQFTDYLQQIHIFVNVFDWSLYSGSIELDRHLWTIPAEYRCSMILFLTHIIVARMSILLRLSTVIALTTWSISWDRWDMWPFWTGLALAELDLLRSRSVTYGSSMPTFPIQDIELKKSEPGSTSSPSRSSRRLSETFYWAVFFVSLFLLSFPDAAGHATPGYITLNKWIPASFSEKHRFWPTVGASLIVWSTCNLRFLRDRVFCWAPIQYLGRISFPLYVMHGPIIHTLGYMVSDLDTRPC